MTTIMDALKKAGYVMQPPAKQSTPVRNREAERLAHIGWTGIMPTPKPRRTYILRRGR